MCGIQKVLKNASCHHYYHQYHIRGSRRKIVFHNNTRMLFAFFSICTVGAKAIPGKMLTSEQNHGSGNTLY